MRLPQAACGDTAQLRQFSHVWQNREGGQEEQDGVHAKRLAGIWARRGAWGRLALVKHAAPPSQPPAYPAQVGAGEQEPGHLLPLLQVAAVALDVRAGALAARRFTPPHLHIWDACGQGMRALGGAHSAGCHWARRASCAALAQEGLQAGRHLQHRSLAERHPRRSTNQLACASWPPERACAHSSGAPGWHTPRPRKCASGPAGSVLLSRSCALSAHGHAGRSTKQHMPGT